MHDIHERRHTEQYKKTQETLKKKKEDAQKKSK